MTDKHTEPRPLREAVAEAIYTEHLYQSDPFDAADAELEYFKDEYWVNPTSFALNIANTAIAAMDAALLSDEAVTAGAETIFNEQAGEDFAWDDLGEAWGSDYGLGKDFYRSSYRSAVERSLRRIGAYGEGGEHGDV